MARQRLTHTPRYDAWLERLRLVLEPAGEKTRLATFMAGERGQSLQTWKVNISRILSAGTVINAEDLLAITAWMDGAPSPRKRRPGKAD